MMELPVYLSVEEFAERYNLDSQTVQEQVEANELVRYRTLPDLHIIRYREDALKELFPVRLEWLIKFAISLSRALLILACLATIYFAWIALGI